MDYPFLRNSFDPNQQIKSLTTDFNVESGLVPKQAKKPAAAAGIPESKGCTPCGLLNVQMSTIRRPPVCAAFISRHFGTLATNSCLIWA